MPWASVCTEATLAAPPSGVTHTVTVGAGVWPVATPPVIEPGRPVITAFTFPWVVRAATVTCLAPAALAAAGHQTLVNPWAVKRIL